MALSGRSTGLADEGWIIRNYAYWLLGGDVRSPLIFLTNENDGDWVREISPSVVPEQPILFYELRKGNYSPVLRPAGLVMFHRDLVDFLDNHSVGGFQRYTAVIRPPKSDVENPDYFVVKASTVTPLSSVTQPAGHLSLSVLREEPTSILVSSELRNLLEESSFSRLRFCEPVLFG